CQHYNSAPYSF
nr:immunoglobulin light chain junction region [Macaca mulatta]MOW64085.1 immunoglobulin light chain junction region [Macaca mulatta]MOW73117.1 immunoglobulin light chain junction region [Macaca mulatta]MOW74041.1 immunoglobulin light chain junction region [Macaca mulatta]